jgi:methylated-DNA-[protein]-cysteine S-methyltransferase
MTTFFEFYSSPLGILKISASDGCILSVAFADQTEPDNPSTLTNKCASQLDEYFRGTRFQFDLPLQYTGTPFQQKIWRELSRIPYAETRSYQEVARAVGAPLAVRATGSANAKNPFAIIVPCHRVVQKNGKPGGYNGGPWRKIWLLAHESSYRSSAS